MISLNSPNPDNYAVGKGRVWMKFDTDPDYVRVGNVTEFEWTPELESLDHFDQQNGEKAKDKSVITSKSAKLRLIMEEWTARNLSIMLMSTPVITGNHAHMEIFSENVKGAAVKYEGTNTIGPKWQFIFNRVEFAPTNSLNPLSEEWAPLEVTGESVRVAGSFGTADCDFTDIVPTLSIAPQIGTDGTPVVGETLVSWPGSWFGSPPTFTYQWKRGGVNIVGATNPTYLLVGADSGTNISLTVTATNAAGSASATTANVAIP